MHWKHLNSVRLLDIEQWALSLEWNTNLKWMRCGISSSIEFRGYKKQWHIVHGCAHNWFPINRKGKTKKKFCFVCATTQMYGQWQLSLTHTHTQVKPCSFFSACFFFAVVISRFLWHISVHFNWLAYAEFFFVVVSFSLCVTIAFQLGCSIFNYVFVELNFVYFSMLIFEWRSHFVFSIEKIWPDQKANLCKWMFENTPNYTLNVRTNFMLSFLGDCLCTFPHPKCRHKTILRFLYFDFWIIIIEREKQNLKPQITVKKNKERKKKNTKISLVKKKQLKRKPQPFQFNSARIRLWRLLKTYHFLRFVWFGLIYQFVCVFGVSIHRQNRFALTFTVCYSFNLKKKKFMQPEQVRGLEYSEIWLWNDIN